MKLSALKAKNLSIFTSVQAKKNGISPQLLTHYIKKGLIERISHGVYRLTDEPAAFDLESLIAEKLKAVPRGVIGLKTALRLYGLTEEIPGEIDIIVPSTNIPKRKLEDVLLHPTKTEIYRTDVKTLRGIPVTSLERTFVDLLRAGESLSMVLNAYRDAKGKKLSISLTKLKKLGTMFHTRRKVDMLVEAIM